MAPPLSPPHGTSIGTTAGITSIITLVAVISFAAQTKDLEGTPRLLAMVALALLVMGAGLLYLARNALGVALDTAGADAPAAGIAAARGLALFHLGMGCNLCGVGCGLGARVAWVSGGAAWLGAGVAASLGLAALGRAGSWYAEWLRRRAAAAPAVAPAAPRPPLRGAATTVAVLAGLVAASGLALWLLPVESEALTLTLALHVATGAMATVAFLVAVPAHLSRVRRLHAPVARAAGLGLAVVVVVSTLSGAVACFPRDVLGGPAHASWALLHGVVSVVAAALLVLHRVAAPAHAAGRPQMVALLLVLAASAAWAFTPPAPARTQASGRLIARPGLMRVSRAGRPELEQLADTESCRECHADIVEQWEGSSHRFASFANPYYLFAFRNTERELGRPATKFCGVCHDPLPLLDGFFDGARPLDERVRHADRGITCMVCHSTVHAEDRRGNGSFELGRPGALLPGGSSPNPLDPLARWLVRIDPRRHVAALASPVLRTAEFCATCHKVGLNEQMTRWRFLRAFNDYDPWQQSAYSHEVALPFGRAERRSCVDCHMTRVPSEDRGARAGGVLDHRFAAANTSLAAVMGDDAWLRREREMLASAGAVAVPLGASDGRALAMPLAGAGTRLPWGREVQLHVLVTAPGVGHLFPGGTLDSTETWVELEVRDADGRLVATHGAVQADGGPPDDAHLLRVRVLDEQGRPITERDVFRQRTVLYRQAAVPGAGQLVRFALTVPPAARAPLAITTRLWFRKFGREFHAAVFRSRQEQEPPQPLLRLFATTVRVGLGPELAQGECEPSATPLLLRYAPSATLQGDTETAAFAARRALDCGGPPLATVLEARAALRAGDPARALELVTPLALAPDALAPPRMVRALALAALGHDEGALETLRGLALEYPRDREVRRELARLSLRSGDAAAAVRETAQLLSIDPEDSGACYVRMLAFAELGDETRRREAARCYERFREDETARVLLRRARALSPEDDLEAEAVHVHDATPPAR